MGVSLSHRTVGTATFAIGLVVGVLIGRHWLDAARSRTRMYHAQTIEAVRSWRGKEDRRERFEQERRAGRHAFPLEQVRELGRVQVGSDCLMRFQLPDSGSTPIRSFRVNVVPAASPVAGIAGHGTIYRERGFDRGERVEVVVPGLSCGDVTVSGYGVSSHSAWDTVIGRGAGSR